MQSNYFSPESAIFVSIFSNKLFSTSLASCKIFEFFNIIRHYYFHYSTITGQQHGTIITGSKSNSKNKVLLDQGWQKGFLTRVVVELGVGELGIIS